MSKRWIYKILYGIGTFLVSAKMVFADVTSLPTNFSTGCASSDINSAIGCIPYGNTSDFVSKAITFGIGIGGALALLMLILGAYEIMTNPAGPEEIEQGKKMITNAILGLLMMIFSVSILKIIGVQILQLPGLPY